MNPNRKVFNRPSLKATRRYLRNNPTPEEELLWKELKGRKLLGRKFRRQHSIEIWIVDFYCPSERLVVELDGSHHYTKEGKLADQQRDEAFRQQLGIRVLRFPNSRVNKNILGVLDEITRYFGTSP